MTEIDMSYRHPVYIEDAADQDIEICRRRIAELYGTTPPAFVTQRLEAELISMVDNRYATLYYIASEVASVSQEHGFPIRADRQMAASFLLFLLGVTEINPLPLHYYCADCGYFEIMEVDDYGTVAFEMEDKSCPNCGTPLKKDGFNIPLEVYLGVGGFREPEIAIHVAPEVYQAVIARLTERFGKSHVLIGCRMDADSSAVHLLPKNVHIDDIPSYDRWELDTAFTTIELIPDDSMSLIRKLALSTGRPYDTIPLKDRDTLQLFRDGDTDGIPVFESERARELITLTKRIKRNDFPSFGSLMRILALSNGIGNWRDDGQRKKLITKGKLNRVIVYRDEVNMTLLAHGIDAPTAERITKWVRTGRLKNNTYDGKPIREWLVQSGIEEDYVQKLENIEYLQSKPWVLSEMLVAWKLAYYKTFHNARSHASGHF